jgi:hypothetical protein
MRAVFAVALCFILGACAIFGKGETDPGRGEPDSGRGEPDIYGIYDLVGDPEPGSGWFELMADGYWKMSVSAPGRPEPMDFAGGFSILEEKDGCVWVDVWTNETPNQKRPSSICDGVLTSPGSNSVFHKRR